MRVKYHPIPLSAIRRKTFTTGIVEDELIDSPNWGYYQHSRSEITKTADWVKRRKNRSYYVPPLSYTSELDTSTVWKGVSSRNYPGYNYLQIGAIASGAPANNNGLPLIGNVHDQALIKAYKNLKDMKINLSVAFAERSSTSSMVLGTAKKLAKSIKHVKKGNIVKAWKALDKPKDPHVYSFIRKSKTGRVYKRQSVLRPKDVTLIENIPPPRGREITNQWLGLQLGWKPFLGDIHGACQAMAERDLDANRYRVTAIGRVETTQLDKSSYSTSFEDVIGFHKLKRACFVRLDYVMDDSSALSSAAALGLTNPFDVAWELLPGSFLLDYFIPIGDWLSCLDATLGYTFLGGSTTDVTENISHYAAQGKNGTTGFYTRKSHKYKSVRSVYGTSPFPRFPGLKVKPMTRNQTATTLAMISSGFGKLK